MSNGIVLQYMYKRKWIDHKSAPYGSLDRETSIRFDQEALGLLHDGQTIRIKHKTLTSPESERIIEETSKNRRTAMERLAKL